MVKRAKLRHIFTQEQYDRELKYGNIAPNGVVFQDDLVSINGCAFYLFKTEKITNKMIAEAKKWIRQHRDVVKFYVCYEH
jgi:hypothetical protein